MYGVKPPLCSIQATMRYVHCKVAKATQKAVRASSGCEKYCNIVAVLILF